MQGTLRLRLLCAGYASIVVTMWYAKIEVTVCRVR